MRTMPLLLVPVVLLLSACEQPSIERPSARNLQGEEIGYFCNMTVVNHSGPKGQVFVAGREQPYWFTSVLDTLMFTRLPDEPGQVLAIYVTDVGRAQWNQPEPDTWVEATSAWYVVGSDKVGGMGAPEIVPFGDRAAAEGFAVRHGGNVLEYEGLTDALLREVAGTVGTPAG